MKAIGYLLITASFLVGSLLAVLKVTTLNWAHFVPVVVVGFAGVAIVQRAIRGHAQKAETITANIESIHNALHNVVTKVTQLNKEKEQINTYDMRHRIDESVLEDLDSFVEARQSIGHKYGLQAYADVMSHYAAGERYLNRVWSASADGYVDEANTYMEKAEVQFTEAFDQLKLLEASHR